VLVIVINFKKYSFFLKFMIFAVLLQINGISYFRIKMIFLKRQYHNNSGDEFSKRNGMLLFRFYVSCLKRLRSRIRIINKQINFQSIDIIKDRLRFIPGRRSYSETLDKACKKIIPYVSHPTHSE